MYVAQKVVQPVPCPTLGSIIHIDYKVSNAPKSCAVSNLPNDTLQLW